MAWGPRKKTVLRYDLMEYHCKMLEADQHPGEHLLLVTSKDGEISHFEWHKKPEPADTSLYTTGAGGVTILEEEP